MSLSEGEKRALLEIVRSTIEGKLQVRGEFCETQGDSRIPSVLQEKRGVFVTLKKRGQLRGCIGYIQPFRPLEQAVKEMALAAAFQDPRFSPLSRDELGEISVEISVLSPLKRIEHPEEIEVGKHGLYIVLGKHSGLLLPQVATEYGWDSLTFLEETCYKAGLPNDAWQDERAVIYAFSAEIIEEPGEMAGPD
ncbi:MAG: AmmeMemoRadiSam system protein A [Syntrophus sp. (in: bacteria)]|nr:AmmeMemoRadiSam system protein A [Syntrophus sp. (in: bacteria)]